MTTFTNNQIEAFLETYCEKVYDMPISDLELKMDAYKCIKIDSIEFFVPKENSLWDEEEEKLHEYIISQYIV